MSLKVKSRFLKYSSILLILLIGCKNDPIPLSKKTLEGMWVPGTIKLDKGLHIANSNILTFQDNLLKHLGTTSQDTFSVKYQIVEEGIIIDTTLIPHKDFFLTKDYFLFDAPYNKTFFRPKEVYLPMSRIVFRNRLRNTSWETKTQDFYFTDEEKVFIQNKGGGTADVYCWRLMEHQGFQFLVIYGNQTRCENYSHPLRQITRISDNSFSTVNHWYKDELNENFNRTNKSLDYFKTPAFQLCNKNLYINNPNNRYYYKGTRLENGHENIRRAIKREYNPSIYQDQNGLVRVRFVVNCEGKTGLFEVDEMTLDYQLTDLDDSMSNKLLDITRTLGPWIPGMSSYANYPIDTYYFITYRIKNGEIVDIFP